MASIVQSKIGYTPASTPASLTLDADPQPGNIVVLVCNSATTVQPPSTTWAQRDARVSSQGVYVWDIVVPAGGLSRTATVIPNGAHPTVMTLLELNGVAFDKLSVTQVSTPAASIPTPSVTTSGAGIVLAVGAIHGVSNLGAAALQNTFNNGFTPLLRSDPGEPVTPNTCMQAVGYKMVTTAGPTGVTTATWSSNPANNIALNHVGYQLSYVPYVAPLTVSAGADQTVEVGLSATLTAAATGGSAPLTYAWTKVSGPTASWGSAGAITTLSNAGGLTAGTYVMRVTVTDSAGVTASDDVTVTVAAPPPSLSVVPVTTTGWSVQGAADAATALSDSAVSSFLASAENPVDQPLVVRLPSMSMPSADLVVEAVLSVVNATTSQVTAQLLSGTTVVATAAALSPLPGSPATRQIRFTKASIASVTSQVWAAGTLTVRILATAA